MSKSITTPPATLSYPWLFKPQPPMEEGGRALYGVVLVFDEKEDLTALKEAVVAAAVDKWGDKAAGLLRAGKLRNPFRDGEEKDYPTGSTFISARSEHKPAVFRKHLDPDSGEPVEIDGDTSDSGVYPGCVVRALVHAYAYDRAGNKGVTFGLDGIQKWGDGERLDGRVNAADHFTFEAATVADLSDLTGEDEDDLPMKKVKKGGGGDLMDLLK